MAHITSLHVLLLRPPLCGPLNCKGGWEMSFKKEMEGCGEQLASLSHSGGGRIYTALLSSLSSGTTWDIVESIHYPYGFFLMW